MTPRLRSAAHGGFTLVEMMMACAVMALTLVSVTLIVRSLFITMNREGFKVREAATLRRAVERMDSDLHWTQRLQTELRTDGSVERYLLQRFSGDPVVYTLSNHRLERWLETPQGPRARIAVAEGVETFALSAVSGEDFDTTFEMIISFTRSGGQRHEYRYAPIR